MIKDGKNIETVFRENYKELCMISCYYTQNIAESEDVVQDLFVTIIAKNRMDSINDFKGYLRIAVRNASLKRIRKSKKVGFISEKIKKTIVSSGRTKEQEMILLEKKALLYKEIEKLPEQCKKTFLLCCADGLKYHETAEVLEISVNTVKSQIKKAYKLLRLSLHGAYFLFCFVGVKIASSLFYGF